MFVQRILDRLASVSAHLLLASEKQRDVLVHFQMCFLGKESFGFLGIT